MTGAIFNSGKLIMFVIYAVFFPKLLSAQRLWYKSPADATAKDILTSTKDDAEWLKALPLGNGKLGAMVFGGVNLERIQLNEKTLWSGSPADNDNPDAPLFLDSIRTLLFAGQFKEATELTNRTQVCKGAGSGYGNGSKVPFGSFQTLGDLFIKFRDSSGWKNYERSLDLGEATAKVFYTQTGVKFHREAFISYAANALVMRITADKRSAISFKASLHRPERFSTAGTGNGLVMKGSLSDGKGGEGMKYVVRLRAKNTGGSQRIEGNELIVENASEVLLYLTVGTDYDPGADDYKSRDFEEVSKRYMTAAFAKPYQKLRNEHLAVYSKYFNRVKLSLSNEPDTIPTDTRLKNIKTIKNDNFLTQLYFQYGRYLLICSSMPGTLPANLQGLWSNKIQTAWNGDYHTNINVQMNYWPAEVTNLSEMHEPLINFIDQISKPASRAAKVQFNAKGWCVSPIVNVWGFTAPGEHPSWGLTPGATGWLCSHLWEHYLYNPTLKNLDKIFPLLSGASRFYLSWLVPDKESGLLVSGPSSSPENSFRAPDGSTGTISMGPAHDQQIIAELFENTITAAERLSRTTTFTDSLRSAKEKLLPSKAGSDGHIMEWAKPYTELEPGHRHFSHLYDLYPGNGFFKTDSPKLIDAARRSLEKRMANGGGQTGWSAAWATNLWARLHEGDSALKAFNSILIKRSALNLFDLHPPFQIDGNFGATAGVAEMLVQSHAGYIELLPALPLAWKEGKVKGLKARGGYIIDMVWKNWKLSYINVTAARTGEVTIKYKTDSSILNIKAGSTKGIAYNP